MIQSLAAAAAFAVLTYFLTRGAERGGLGGVKTLSAASAMALVMTALSSLVASARHAGMGTYRTHGWPKPFYGHWSGFEGGRRTDWMVFYAAVDLIFWFAAFIFLAAALQVVSNRRRRATPVR